MIWSMRHFYSTSCLLDPTPASGRVTFFFVRWASSCFFSAHRFGPTSFGAGFTSTCFAVRNIREAFVESFPILSISPTTLLIKSFVSRASSFVFDVFGAFTCLFSFFSIFFYASAWRDSSNNFAVWVNVFFLWRTVWLNSLIKSSSDKSYQARSAMKGSFSMWFTLGRSFGSGLSKHQRRLRIFWEYLGPGSL